MTTSDHPTLLTRLAHMGLALAVIAQLGSSLVMVPPRPDRPGNVFFDIHEYVGMVAMAQATLFWLVVVFRRAGTSLAALVPWLSKARRAAVWDDAKHHAAALRGFRLPAYDATSPFAAAIHGLGLLLITYMAASGTIFWLAVQAGMGRALTVRLLMDLHGAFANLVWAYLIGHAALALAHHYLGHFRITKMWSLRRGA